VTQVTQAVPPDRPPNRLWGAGRRAFGPSTADKGLHLPGCDRWRPQEPCGPSVAPRQATAAQEKPGPRRT